MSTLEKLTWEDAERLIMESTVEVRDDEALVVNPMVTVGILTFRHAETIRESVENVLNQETDFPSEIVIADDGSDDGTVEIIEALQREHPDRIRLLLARENLGKHTGNGRLNLIRLWRANRGRYFHLLDGDDWWTDKTKLGKQVAFLEHHSECTLCWHRGKVVYDEGMPETAKLMGEVFPPGEFSPVMEGSELLWSNWCLTSTVLYRRGICEQLPEEFLWIRIGDWPLVVLHAREGKIGFIDEVMSAYRFHSSGIWSSKPPFDQILGFLHVMAQAYEWIPEKHRKRYQENLGQLLAEQFSMNHSKPLGSQPSSSFGILIEILQTPGVEKAFMAQLDCLSVLRAEKMASRDGKLAALRSQVSDLKETNSNLKETNRELKRKPKGFLNRILGRRGS